MKKRFTKFFSAGSGELLSNFINDFSEKERSRKGIKISLVSVSYSFGLEKFNGTGDEILMHKALAVYEINEEK